MDFPTRLSLRILFNLILTRKVLRTTVDGDIRNECRLHINRVDRFVASLTSTAPVDVHIFIFTRTKTKEIKIILDKNFETKI